MTVLSGVNWSCREQEHMTSVFRSGRRGESLELDKFALSQAGRANSLNVWISRRSPHGDSCEGGMGGSDLKGRRMNSQL